MTPAELAAARALSDKMSDAYFDHLAPRCSYRSAGDGMACGLTSGHEGHHVLLMPKADGWGYVADVRPTILALLAHIEAVETERAELRAKLAEVETTLADERGAVRAMLRERLDPLWSAMRTAQSEETQSYLQGRREEVIGLLTRLDAMLPAACALADRGSDAR